MKISVPIDIAARQLHDITKVNWPSATLVDYLNYAIMEIIDKKPSANPVTSLVTMVAGTVQNLPSGSIYLISPTRNMGTGSNPGRSITSINKKSIDSFFPHWRTFPAQNEVRHIVYDEERPLVFEVFPQQPVGTLQKIEVICSKYPTRLTTYATDDFPLGSEYETSTVDYMIFRALKEETTIPNAQAKADSFYSKFLRDLGVKDMTAEKLKQGER